MATELMPTPPGAPWPPPPPKFFGLRELTLPVNTPLNTKDEVADALQRVLPDHMFNARQTREMYQRYMNDQPILNKCRVTRPELNNIVVENWLWAIVQFKLGFETPDGITYNSADKDTEILPIDVLNTCARLDNEDAKLQEADMWKYVTGTSFKICRPEDPDLVTEDGDAAPYYTAVLHPETAGVVYSSSPRKKRLLGFTFSEEYTKDGLPQVRLQAYTNTNMYEWIVATNNPFSMSSTTDRLLTRYTDDVSWDFVQELTLMPFGVPIIEKRLNPNRMGYVALLASLQDAINKLQSGRLDALDNFVEALLVFINCQPPTDEETGEWKQLSTGQSLSVKGTPDMPASVQYLVAQLDQNGAQVTKEDLVDAFFEIGGMPSRSARSGGGQDTGQATFLRDGWGDADTRANIAVKEGRMAEMDMLRIKLPILRNTEVSRFDIQDLSLSDVFVDIPRNRNNNLLVKAQALQMLLAMGIDKELAFQAVNLFEDPNAAAELSKDSIDKALGFNEVEQPQQDTTSPDLYAAQELDQGQSATPVTGSN